MAYGGDLRFNSRRHGYRVALGSCFLRFAFDAREMG